MITNKKMNSRTIKMKKSQSIWLIYLMSKKEKSNLTGDKNLPFHLRSKSQISAMPAGNIIIFPLKFKRDSTDLQRSFWGKAITKLQISGLSDV